ncbi:MAG: tetratricopeptide (TPR) repeat protein [Mariniblastus sp.]|jgi:tetratricopeptide (TPR) repeat protein
MIFRRRDDDGFDSTLISKLMAPFKSLWHKIFRRREDDGFDSSLMSKLMGPFQSLWHGITDLLKGDDRVVSEQGGFSTLRGVLSFPFRLFWGFLVFMVQSWASSRPGRAFIGAVPAIFCGGLFFAALLAADFRNTKANQYTTNTSYLMHYQETSPDVPEFAHIFAERLLELRPEDPKIKYQLGLSYDRLESPARAFDVMSYLMSPVRELDKDSDKELDQELVSAVRTWTADYYAKLPEDQISDDERERKVIENLEFAIEADPTNQKAPSQMTQVYLRRSNQFEKGSEEYLANIKIAAEYMIMVCNGPMTVYRLRGIPILAQLQIELGKERLARDWLEGEIKNLMVIAKNQPNQIVIWRIGVICAMIAEDFEKAIRIAQDGIRFSLDEQNKAELQKLEAVVKVKMADEYTDMGDKQSYRDRLALLCQAIKLNPRELDFYLRLLDYAGTRPPSTEGAEGQTDAEDERLDFSNVGKDWLSDAVVKSRLPERRGNLEGTPLAGVNYFFIDSPDPGVVHVLLGLEEVSNGNISSGEKHWRIAGKQFPLAQVIINNLIQAASERRSDEFANLNDMATLGIELFPNDPGFYVTRGSLYQKQLQFDEAIKDLLYVSEELPKSIVIHDQLSECYEAIGDVGNADLHRELKKELLMQIESEKQRKLEEPVSAARR